MDGAPAEARASAASLARTAWAFVAPHVYYPLVAAAAVLLFGLYYRRWPGADSFGIPVAYNEGGDVFLVLGIAEGFSELPPPWDLHVDRLNAPFGADWNDYPHTEKLIFYAWGLLLRVFDAGVTANIFMLSAHVTAALGFAWAARRVTRSDVAGVAGSLLFAFSNFIMARSLGHVNVSFVWHLPLLVVLTLWLAELETVPSRRVQAAAALLLVATNLQNPYYPPLAFQLVALATLRSFFRRRREVARFGASLLGIGLATFLLGQANVFLRSWTAGPNTAFSGRSLEAIRIWALRLPDLFMPVGHPISAWSDFSRTHYFLAGNPISENAAAFLGLTGCVLFVLLLGQSFVRGLAGRLSDIPGEAWLVGYLLLFSLSGGIDYLIGALGMTWLRAVNRYSIVILAIVLLWGCRVVASLSSPWGRRGLPLAALALGVVELFDGGPDDKEAYFKATARTVESDRRFGRQLDEVLPEGARVFQLPVLDFPESAPILDMPDCSHFRPVFWSELPSFSYGTHKGRPRETWQLHVEQLSPRAMVAYLQDHGFDALMVNRRGLPAAGRWLESSLERQDLTLVAEADTKDMAVYRLEATDSKVPRDYASLGLHQGFPWGWEEGPRSNWAWSNGDARLRLIVSPESVGRYRVRFEAEGLVERRLDVVIDGKVAATATLVPGRVVPISFEWQVTQPVTGVELRTNVPALEPGNGDRRRLGFRIVDPSAEPVRRGARR